MEKDILLLGADEKILKSYYRVLAENSYSVRCVKSMYEARIYLAKHHPKLFVIGDDWCGASARFIYDSMVNLLRETGVQAIVIEEALFDNELIERVKRALES